MSKENYEEETNKTRFQQCGPGLFNDLGSVTF